MITTVSRQRIEDAQFEGLSDELEAGAVLFFPTSPITLPSAEDQVFLRGSLGERLKRKNVSFHPEAGKVVGMDGEPELRKRTQAILSAHSRRVQDFLQQALPSLVPGWTVGTTSFRPLEEKGRNLSAHASNELVHVDAGAYGATNGDRILRFFCNLNLTQDRVWATKGAFPELYRRYGKQAGIAPPRRTLERGALGKARHGLLRGFSSMGLPLARVLDSSPYDRAMRRFHNFMKDTPAFQETREGHQEFRFPPFSSWMVLTDMVSHACLSGRYALVDTFLIPLENCRRQELSPKHILQHGLEPAPA